ncbi:MAG: NUDIX domain-containing protein [Candidatus Liptonbacteria bacterium]|nr:NUDIX domain-containing protein [Candidatus Liptonbacteria bacterium]
MPHIHEKIDFAVGVFVVHRNRVLLVFHKNLKMWLPLGGHIELDEDPEQALFREVKEESGLDIEMISQKPKEKFEGRKFLYPPAYLDIHPIGENHRHIGMVYFAKSKSEKVTLAAEEHDEIRWFSERELQDPTFKVQPDIQFYAKEALQRAQGTW